GHRGEQVGEVLRTERLRNEHEEGPERHARRHPAVLVPGGDRWQGRRWPRGHATHHRRGPRAVKRRTTREGETVGRVMTRVLVGLVLAQAAWIAYPAARARVLALEDTPAARGQRLARELGCFACHGPLGAGGVINPGSFKGYIPAFWGADFDDLVRDDKELRRWIAAGEIPRLAEHPIGGWFFRRQTIKMAAYERFLPKEDI